ncbi:MAG: hypothetical protein HS104_04905 [Polyangiaceae bacterium]|nr:hypothetical protein [Polyangiaceae bacterium]MCE7888720.1 hypothetical protein [Sorangiineae bacterium PRO1]MCL4753763.1 hypothetical protein [Myxococcales bacterium]
MEVWIYMALAAAATVVPAVGLSLACRAQLDRSDDERQPRWVRAKSALVAAVGGAAAVVQIGDRRERQRLEPAAEPLPESK